MRICSLFLFFVLRGEAVTVTLDSKAQIRQHFRKGRCLAEPSWYEDYQTFEFKVNDCAYQYYILDFLPTSSSQGLPWQFSEMRLYSAEGQIPSLTYHVGLVNTTDGSIASGCYVNGTQTAADFAVDDLLETDVCGDSAAIKLRISFA